MTSNYDVKTYSLKQRSGKNLTWCRVVIYVTDFCVYLFRLRMFWGANYIGKALVNFFLSIYLSEEGFFVFDACSLLKYIGNYCCTLWLWCTHVLCEIIWFLYWKVNYQCWSYRKRKRRDRRNLWISWSLAMGAAQRDSIITSSTMLRNGELHELWQSFPCCACLSHLGFSLCCFSLL